MLKKMVSLCLTVTMLLTFFALQVNATKPVEQGYTLGEPVYFMGFEPVNGVFYDAPANYSDVRQEVQRFSATTLTLPYGQKIVDNRRLKSTGSMITVNDENPTRGYAGFSKGEDPDVDGFNQFNTGASGAADDYCLKVIQLEVSAVGVKIALPETYGGPDDAARKYRIEMDYKWQSYKSTENDASALSTAAPRGASDFLTFRIGDATLKLNTNLTRPGGGGNADLWFGGSSFGLTSENQAVTGRYAPALPAYAVDAPNKWNHITIDFDFEYGTIDFLMECADGSTREINTEIPKDDPAYMENFGQGLSVIGFRGNISSTIRATYVDNIKITPIALPAGISEAVFTDGEDVYEDGDELVSGIDLTFKADINLHNERVKVILAGYSKDENGNLYLERVVIGDTITSAVKDYTLHYGLVNENILAIKAMVWDLVSMKPFMNGITLLGGT